MLYVLESHHADLCILGVSTEVLDLTGVIIIVIIGDNNWGRVQISFLKKNSVKPIGSSTKLSINFMV